MKKGDVRPGRHRPRGLFPFSFQAAGASDRAGARVIFVILSILLILSPAGQRRVAMPGKVRPCSEGNAHVLQVV